MTRIDFKVPAPVPRDAQEIAHQQQLGQAHASVGVSLMLNGGPSGAAAIAGTVRLVQRSHLQASDPAGYLAQEDARHALRGLAGGLVDGKGQVQSGYLSLSADGTTLSNTSRWRAGDRGGAVSKVRALIEQAYGQRMAALGMKDSLDAAVERYLSRSGGKLGTRSLVALIKDLEFKLADDASFLKEAQVGGARLDIESVQAERLPRQPDQALKKLLALYEAQPAPLLAAEKAVVQREYPWAEGGQVADQPISPGRDDYRITGFADFKVMERLAQERGLAPQDFMALLKRQGPDVLIDPGGASHPATLGKQLHRDLVTAFEAAATLDEFHAATSELGLKTADTLRSERALPAPLPRFPSGSLQHAAAQALESLGAGQAPQALAAPSPDGPVAWPRFQQPQWPDQDGPPIAQSLYDWGISLLFSALNQQARSDDLGPLNDLLQGVAGRALDAESGIALADELAGLLGAVPDNSALAFGRDCLQQALSWSPHHALPYQSDTAPADHPLRQLNMHPFLRSPEAAQDQP